MTFTEIVVVCAIITVARAGVVPPARYAAAAAARTSAAGAAVTPGAKITVEKYATGDSKSQHESRDGDGTKCTVEYTTDPQSGFSTVVVHREPLAHAVDNACRLSATVVKIAAPVDKVAAPVDKVVGPAADKAAAPVFQAAPITKLTMSVVQSAPIAYSAPVVYAAPVYQHFSC